MKVLKVKLQEPPPLVNSYSRQPINASRNVKSFQDIDKAPAGFVVFEKNFYMDLRGFLMPISKTYKRFLSF